MPPSTTSILRSTMRRRRRTRTLGDGRGRGRWGMDNAYPSFDNHYDSAQPAAIAAVGGRSPWVTVGAFVLKGSTVLLGRRRSPIGLGNFALPGGRLQFGESFEDCAVRKVREETGLEIQGLEVLTVVNDVLESSHFVTILLQGPSADPEQEAENVEPEKCDGWGWYEWGEPPEPLFRPLEVLVRSGFSRWLRKKRPHHQLPKPV